MEAVGEAIAVEVVGPTRPEAARRAAAGEAMMHPPRKPMHSQLRPRTIPMRSKLVMTAVLVEEWEAPPSLRKPERVTGPVPAATPTMLGGKIFHVLSISILVPTTMAERACPWCIKLVWQAVCKLCWQAFSWDEHLCLARSIVLGGQWKPIVSGTGEQQHLFDTMSPMLQHVSCIFSELSTFGAFTQHSSCPTMSAQVKLLLNFASSARHLPMFAACLNGP